MAATLLKIPTIRLYSRAIRFDAAQGITEVHSELYGSVLRASSDGDDAAMRQEPGQGGGLCSAAGHGDGGAR